MNVALGHQDLDPDPRIRQLELGGPQIVDGQFHAFVQHEVEGLDVRVTQGLQTRVVFRIGLSPIRAGQVGQRRFLGPDFKRPRIGG